MIRIISFSLLAVIMFLAGLSVRPLMNDCGVLVKGDIEETQKNQITEFIISYFDSWNSRDWSAYKEHFSSSAYILNSKNGRLSKTPLDPFIAGQEISLKTTRLPLYETAEEIIIEANDESASVAVNWKLTNLKTTSRGVDRFTLWRDEESNWKIVSLYFAYTETDSEIK